MLCLFALVMYLCSANSYVTLKVEPKSEECFYEDVQAGHTVEFDYHVIDGGLLDVDIRVFQGVRQIFSKLYFEGKDESKYTFTAPEGTTYGFCFNNEMSRYTVKTVQFSLFVKKNDHQNAAGDTTRTQSLIQDISRNLHQIESLQQTYRIKEHMHRNLAEETNSRVYIWSIIESVFLLLICAAQVFYLRRLFTRS